MIAGSQRVIIHPARKKSNSDFFVKSFTTVVHENFYHSLKK